MPDAPPAAAAPVSAPVGIVLSADDYGLAPGVGRAIRDLLAAGRLSATGCMTVSPLWPAEGEALKPFAATADLGLHLTLTDQRPLGSLPELAPQGRFPRLGRLIGLAHAGRLDRAEIAAEVERQIDRFEAVMGRPPDFIDGHHHVHQLPTVGEVVIEAFRRRLAPRGGYLRYCAEPLGAVLRCGVAPARAALIAALGRSFRRRAEALDIPGNTGFRGVRSFRETRPYAELFARFLRGAAPGTLIMCHPGLVDATLAAADPVTAAREEEYRTLAGDAFPAQLRAAGVRLVRLAGAGEQRRGG